jgi:Protein of unknown function (DUF4054)
MGCTDIPLDKMPDWIKSFRARFPEFETNTEESIAYAISDASQMVDCCWVNCGLAILYLAAHYLALARIAACALPDCSEEGAVGGGGVIGGGQVTRLQFETMGVSFSAPQFAAGNAAMGGGPGEGPYTYEMTPYGQRYLTYMKLSNPAILVV